LWISDEGCWVIFVEFQPSAWSKGSYLNVNPHWLWLRYGANVHFPRPADFISFESVEQFKPLIENMASIAARTVLDLRAKFRTLRDVNDLFAARVTRDGHPVYRAAITAGLVGDIAAARSLFQRMEATDMEEFGPWIRNLTSDAAKFAALLDDPDGYRAAILKAINEQRLNLRLPPLPTLESMDSKGAARRAD